jgi:hypothetical protein
VKLDYFPLKNSQTKVNLNKLEIIDELVIKGVSPDREMNDSNIDYLLDKTKEQDGLRQYLHKFFMGDHLYYLYPLMASADSAQIRDKFMEMKKERAIAKDMLILRMVVLFQLEQGTFHMALFENLLKATSLSHNSLGGSFSQWVNTHKIVPSDWKISDIDNYMGGNPYFSKVIS